MKTLTVTKKYLVFPINNSLPPKRLSFRKDGEEVYYLDLRLDNVAPDFEAWIDVSRFAGEELTLMLDKEMPLSFREEETMDLPGIYDEPLRPQVHFSTKIGWNNDPNGLTYLNGTYHMFYQHNPGDKMWGNMHWGYATSTDLIHWEEQGDTIFPDRYGAIFSGSGFVDEKNVLGLQTGEIPTLVFYYTATDPFSQHMYVSTDGGKTLRPYRNGPVIPHIIGSNRDPKITYVAELDAYVLALYLDGETYALFSSQNLVDWKEFQRIDIPGDNECPDIFCLNNDRGERRWILIGAHDKYFVGEFTDGKFQPLQPVQSLSYGRSSYAAQSFSHLPNGRNIRVAWLRWMDISGKNFSQQMGIPTELTLECVNGLEYLCLTPVKELETLYISNHREENLALTAGNPYILPVGDHPVHFTLEIDPVPAGKLTVGWFGREFTCDFAENQMTLGEAKDKLSIDRSKLRLNVVIDRCSIEIFSDGGKIGYVNTDSNTICDRNLPYLTLTADKDLTVTDFTVHTLKSIWQK